MSLARWARCVASILLLTNAVPVRSQEAAGGWIGQLNSGFKVRIHISKSGSGYTGYLTNPSGNETDVDQIQSDGSHLHFAATKLNLTYDGTWNAPKKGWSGSLTLLQQVYPLLLRRETASDLAPTVHKRPQEERIAAGHLPYDQKDIQFENLPGKNRLAGTVSFPHGRGPFPAIVLVSGTGRNTRDEDVMGHKVFVVLADALGRGGFAVLRYDKRGVGGSTGDFDAATTQDFATDANAAVSWLRAQPEIERERIGILGHSEGGIIAPMVAATDKHVAFVVMLAGPALRGDKLFVLQSAMTARAYGAPEDYIVRRKVFDQNLYDAIIGSSSRAAAMEKAKRVIAEGVNEKLVDQNEASSLAQSGASVWERYFLAYDPARTLSQLRIPVLAIYGSLDVQVPGKENLIAARAALKNDHRATLVLMPGKNHLLQDAKTGSPNEYNDIEETMSPSALGLIADWASRITRNH